MKVAIIDYGMGNLYSVAHACGYLGVDADIQTSPEKLFNYDRLILPGVGAFGDAMKELSRRKLIRPIKDFITAGRLFLGICLGMQLLFESSQEAPGVPGLSLIRGDVRRFSNRLKCPHMGWNSIVTHNAGEPFFRDAPKNAFAYFCHSYYVRPKKAAVAIGQTDYGRLFASIVRQDNLYGVQFHPEKSQTTGLNLLNNFLKIC